MKYLKQLWSRQNLFKAKATLPGLKFSVGFEYGSPLTLYGHDIIWPGGMQLVFSCLELHNTLTRGGPCVTLARPRWWVTPTSSLIVHSSSNSNSQLQLVSSLLFNHLTLASAEEEEEKDSTTTTTSTTLTRPRHLTGGSPTCKYFSRCIATAPQLCTAIPLGRVALHWERTAEHVGNQNTASKVALVCQKFGKVRAKRTFQNHCRTFVCLFLFCAPKNLQLHCNLPY